MLLIFLLKRNGSQRTVYNNNTNMSSRTFVVANMKVIYAFVTLCYQSCE